MKTIRYCHHTVLSSNERLQKAQASSDVLIRACLQCFFDKHNEWYCRDQDLMRARYREDDDDKTEST